MRELLECTEIKLLVTGLAKSGTVALIVRSKVMPSKGFHEIFKDWPLKDDLDLNRLRLKTSTLFGPHFNITALGHSS